MWLVRSALLLLGSLHFLAHDARAELQEKAWWETTLVYQIWPRAFQDSDGDGEGDLQGIISRLDHIVDLGVETIWLNPIYPSPLVDSGYDVSNYVDINPIFGTLDDFDELLSAAHSNGLKLILDIVINHSSDDHEWFDLSVNRVEPYTDYYIWRNGSVDNETNVPPNNWAGHFSSSEEGSAWTWNSVREQWFYHHFHETQPDLNLRNEAVVQEMMDVLDFWLERGVDGFRFGAVPHFFENEDLLDNPENSTVYTFGLTESAEFLYDIRAHIDNWIQDNDNASKLLVAEVYDTDEYAASFYGNSTHEGIPPFNYRFITEITSSSDASYIKESLDTWMGQLPSNASTNWLLSNHDYSRVASRFAVNRVDGLNMLNLLLPGQAYTYYGDEIGMLDASISWSDTIDFLACAQNESTYATYSRDPARTPMQWNSSTSAGFSTNSSTFLPVHTNYQIRNVELQLSSSSSNIQTYKALASIRKQPTFTHGDYEIAALNGDRVLVLLSSGARNPVLPLKVHYKNGIIDFTRLQQKSEQNRSLDDYPIYLCVINLGLARQTINLTALYSDLPDTLYISILSNNAILTGSTVSSESFELTANAAVVLTDVEPETTTVPTTVRTTVPTTVSTTVPTTVSTAQSTTESSTESASESTTATVKEEITTVEEQETTQSPITEETPTTEYVYSSASMTTTLALTLSVCLVALYNSS